MTMCVDRKRRYDRSEKGLARKRRYQRSPKHTATLARHKLRQMGVTQ